MNYIIFYLMLIKFTKINFIEYKKNVLPKHKFYRSMRPVTFYKLKCDTLENYIDLDQEAEHMFNNNLNMLLFACDYDGYTFDELFDIYESLHVE